MADIGKQRYVPSDNYFITLVLRNKEVILFPDYDGKARSFIEAKRELNEVIYSLSKNPFGKVKLSILLGYDSDSFMDRDILSCMVDEVSRSHRTTNIRLEKVSSNISFKS